MHGPERPWCAGWMITLPRTQVKQVKDAVKGAGWLDSSRKSSHTDSGFIHLPISAACAQAIENGSESLPALVKSAIQEGSMSLEWGELQFNTRQPVPPFQRLREVIKLPWVCAE